MDDDSSFSETFNYYSNAVNRLQDSDEEDLSYLKVEEYCSKTEAVKNEAIPSEVSSMIPKKQRRKKQRQCESPTNIQEEMVSKRVKRSRRIASLQSCPSFGSSDSEMLTIIEINDSPPISPQDTNRDKYDPDVEEVLLEKATADELEVACETAERTDLLTDGLSDHDVSISCTDVEEDLEVVIHVKWRMKVSKPITLKKLGPMKEVFKYIAESEGVPQNQISLTYNGQPISPYDTPEKLKSSVIILEGNLKAVSNSAEQPPEEVDPNQIELKVLRKDKRNKLSIFILRSEPLEVFMEKTAKEMNLPRSKLVFKFDGDILESSETPESMDLEGGECIEVFEQS